MTITAKELKEKLGKIPDDMPIVVSMGEERLDGDIVDLYIKNNGDIAILEVII